MILLSEKVLLYVPKNSFTRNSEFLMAIRSITISILSHFAEIKNYLKSNSPYTLLKLNNKEEIVNHDIECLDEKNISVQKAFNLLKDALKELNNQKIIYLLIPSKGQPLKKFKYIYQIMSIINI